MDAMTRWDPFRELDDLHKRMSTILGRAPVRREGEREEALTFADWAPLVDIIEDDKEFLIKAELPEVTKEAVKVTVQDDVLSIAGERHYDKENKGKKIHRMERAYGRFTRSFTLPENADTTKVKAEFHDGVLNVRVPKTEAAKPKRVEVKIG